MQDYSPAPQGAFSARISPDALREALALFAVTGGGGIIEKRNTIPILGCVLLECDRDRVTVRGTDLDMTLTIEVPAACDVTGRVAVDFFPFLAAVKKLKGETVTLEDVGTGLALRSDTGAAMRLSTRERTDWPGDLKVWNACADDAQWTAGAAQLAAELARVLPCVSDEDTRYYLNGVFIHRSGDNLKLVATDGHRLGVVTRTAPDGCPAELADGILPKKAARMLAKVLAKHDGEVRLRMNGSQFAASWGRCRMTTKLVDGTFPDYSRVIPSHWDRSLTVQANELASAVQDATAHMSDRCRAAVISADGEGLRVSGRDAETGTAIQPFAGEFEAVTGHDGEFHIGFNAKYARDLLLQFKGQEIAFLMGDANCPMRIESKAAPELLYVLMPIRVDVGASAADVERTPLHDFQDRAPAMVRTAMEKPKSKAERRLKARHLRALGELTRQAVEFQATVLTDRRQARLSIMAMLASYAGDDAAVAAFAAMGETQPRGSFAAYVEAEAAIQGREEPEGEPVAPEQPKPDTRPAEAPEPEPEPAEAGLYGSMQDFRVAAVPGSRWAVDRWSEGDWHCAGEFVVTDATARGVDLRRPESLSTGYRFAFPKADGWRSDREGLISLRRDGQPHERLRPLEAVEAVQAAPTAQPDVTALLAAVESLTAKVSGLEEMLASRDNVVSFPRAA